MPCSSRGVLRSSPSKTSEVEPPPSRLIARSRAELGHQLGQLAQRQPGVVVGAAVARHARGSSPASRRAPRAGSGPR